MLGKHGCYVIKCDSEIFYCGYIQDRPLQDRLKEHIYSALHPTTTQSINDIVRGDKSDKNKIITIAVNEGWDLTIEPILVKELWEEVDEDQMINHLRNEGHTLTNLMSGGMFQPYCLVNGKLVETSKVNRPELRSEIQTWKTKKKTVKSFEEPPKRDKKYLKKCRNNAQKRDQLHQLYFG